MPANVKNMLEAANAAVPRIDPAQARDMIARGNVLVIDVRDAPKTHLPGALLIPLETLAANLHRLEAAKTKSIVVYCGNGSTLGPRAVPVLNQAGFAHAVNLAPGIEGWRAANLPVVSS